MNPDFWLFMCVLVGCWAVVALYHEDRIEALKKRIQELETENARLTKHLQEKAP